MLYLPKFLLHIPTLVMKVTFSTVFWPWETFLLLFLNAWWSLWRHHFAVIFKDISYFLLVLDREKSTMKFGRKSDSLLCYCDCLKPILTMSTKTGLDCFLKKLLELESCETRVVQWYIRPFWLFSWFAVHICTVSRGALSNYSHYECYLCRFSGCLHKPLKSHLVNCAMACYLHGI